MLTLRRGLAVLALAAAAVVVPALPASAHTGSFERDCDSVTVNLVMFAESSEDDPNIVNVFRNGEQIDTIEFTGRGTSKEYPETSAEPVEYSAEWKKTGEDNHSGGARPQMLSRPGNCAPIPVCVDDGDFSFTLDGAAGTATVTLDAMMPLCEPATALLAAYETEGADLASSGQHTVFSQQAVQIVEPGEYPLAVELPDCFFEVDLYFFAPGDEPMEAADFAGTDPLAESLANAVIGAKDAPPAMFNAGEECPEAPAPPQGSDDRDLAATGVSHTATLLGLGALLLLAGTGLLYMTRRRRVSGTPTSG